MIRKYYNQTLQTNTRHYEEETQNTKSHKASERQSSQLFLPQQDDYATIKEAKYLSNV